MKAILIERGIMRSVYMLQRKEGICEVKIFFDKNIEKPNKAGIIDGFLKYIDIIKDDVSKFTNNMKKCWKERDEMICEFRKGHDRISFFDYPDEQKILLCTHFRKYKSLKKGEYKRAVRLKKEFDKDPVWVEY